MTPDLHRTSVRRTRNGRWYAICLHPRCDYVCHALGWDAVFRMARDHSLIHSPKWW